MAFRSLLRTAVPRSAPRAPRLAASVARPHPLARPFSVHGTHIDHNLTDKEDLACVHKVCKTVIPDRPNPFTSAHADAPPTCLQMIREMREFDNDTLVMMAIEGNADAVKERLIREIMAKDEVEWDDANVKFEEIARANASGMALATFPYKAGIMVVTASAFATFPLCFDLEAAKWFNDLFVTADVADPEDLETVLEVGSWTWGWMEPPLGQLSFFLLCLQFARAQMDKIGQKAWTGFLLRRRAEKLSTLYPQYHKSIIEDYAYDTGLF